MNYIKALKSDVQNLKRSQARTDTAIHYLERYLNSSKFSCGDELDGYVNVEDVKRHIIIIKDALHSKDDHLEIE